MMNKTYKTLDGAYARADKLGAKCFGAEFYGHANRVEEAIFQAFHTQTSVRLAKHNLVKLDKSLYALECTKEGTYKWTSVGHFDSEGLLYPVAGAVETESKHDKVIKVKAHKPKQTGKGKGNGIDFGKVDGKTKSTRNKSAHKLILATGVKVGTDEYKALWEQWVSVR